MFCVFEVWVTKQNTIVRRFIYWLMVRPWTLNNWQMKMKRYFYLLAHYNHQVTYSNHLCCFAKTTVIRGQNTEQSQHGLPTPRVYIEELYFAFYFNTFTINQTNNGVFVNVNHSFSTNNDQQRYKFF